MKKAPAYKPASGKKARPSRATRPIVLVTEDEEMNFMILKAILHKDDAQVLRARDGLEAVEITKRIPHKIDLILMDLNLPILDGYEAMRRIKKNHPGIPIIAQTAYTFDNDERRCLAAGFNGYLSKPIKDHKLQRLMNDNLQ